MSSLPWDRDARFTLAHEVTQAFEGGKSRDPNDLAVGDVAPGEVHTYRGVRAATWKAWAAKHGLAHIQLEEAKVSQIRQLYWEEFWLVSGAGKLYPPLDLVIFDAAVNHGPGRAVRWLQALVGADVDGKVGRETRLAASKYEPSHVAEGILWDRLWLYHRIIERRPNQESNLRGWVDRQINLRMGYLWGKGLPAELGHRKEFTLWIELRELHARAKHAQYRGDLLTALPRLYLAKENLWAEYPGGNPRPMVPYRFLLP